MSTSGQQSPQGYGIPTSGAQFGGQNFASPSMGYQANMATRSPQTSSLQPIDPSTFAGHGYNGNTSSFGATSGMGGLGGGGKTAGGMGMPMGGGMGSMGGNPAARGGYGAQDFGPMPPPATPGYGSGDNPAWMNFLGGGQNGSATPGSSQILDQRYADYVRQYGAPMWTGHG